ncbi:hypothetical protein BC834DRAFT_492851 [Gloeopeniophorella convolvens]|nr:hypothetical protein BC834DRAFT_492851 [Gloeopeniophorella convolvens]
MDLVFGSFERAFPWDIAYNFDMLIAYYPSPDADDVLLYMKGHLSFFRHSPEVTRQFLTFPNFRTQHTFLTLPWIETDAEEAEYSHFALLQTNLTFLQFDAMVPTRFHLTAGGGAGGTYSLFNDGQWEFAALGAQTDPAARLLFSDLMDEHARGWAPRATFSDAGHEREVHLRGGESAHFVWFDRKYAVDYLSAFTDPNVFIGARYVMRRAPGGRVVERFEPEPDAKIIVPPLEGPSIDYGHWDHWNRPYLHEMLYNHFQNEKYARECRLCFARCVRACVLMYDVLCSVVGATGAAAAGGGGAVC